MVDSKGASGLLFLLPFVHTRFASKPSDAWLRDHLDHTTLHYHILDDTLIKNENNNYIQVVEYLLDE
jgi:hypothetical protein